MVKLQANAALVRDAGLHRAEIVATLPVGVGQHVIGHALAPGLRTIDVGGNHRGFVVRHGQAVKAAERAVQEIAVVIDVVVRGEQHRVELLRHHVLAHLGHAVGVLLRGKGVLYFLAVAQANQAGHVFNHGGSLK